MNKYDKAAMLIGKYGTGAEADAIVLYLEYISATEKAGNPGKLDLEVIANAKERIADEINHLLGDTLDAMRIADLKISPDGIDKIFEGLKALVDNSVQKSTSDGKVETPKQSYEIVKGDFNMTVSDKAKTASAMTKDGRINL